MRIIVIGCGPAGLAAAINAAKDGMEVLILERLNKPALKLLASGGSRCNITNTLEREPYMAAFGKNGRFMQNVLSRYYHDELFSFFRKHGLRFLAKDGFHYFPETERAADVFDALQNECGKHRIAIRTNTTVSSILQENGHAAGVETESREHLEAGAVILAAGGCARPGLGGSMRGLKLAEKAGHTFEPPFPAMAPVIIPDPQIRSLAGITIGSAALEFHLNKRTVFRTAGELLFTHTGLSGPCAIDLAGEVAAAAAAGPVELLLHVRKDSSDAYWRGLFAEWRKKYGRKEIATLLGFELPSRLADLFCSRCGCTGTKVSMMTASQEADLAKMLSAFPLSATGSGPMDCAMAMKGGIRLKEIFPETLESRILPGLFFAGEIMDLTGPCGGYNLQWAFSSGFAAGESALAAVRIRQK